MRGSILAMVFHYTNELGEEITSMPSGYWKVVEVEIEKQKHENAKLISAVDELIKCAEFYADKGNWLRNKNGWRHDMIEADLDDETLTDWEGRFSGKRARTTLAEVKKRLGRE